MKKKCEGKNLRLRLLRVIAKHHGVAGDVVEALLTIDVSIGCISKSISSVVHINHDK